MSYRADKLGVDAHTQTHTQTVAGNDNTRRPKLAWGKNVLHLWNIWNIIMHFLRNHELIKRFSHLPPARGLSEFRPTLFWASRNFRKFVIMTIILDTTFLIASATKCMSRLNKTISRMLGYTRKKCRYSDIIRMLLLCIQLLMCVQSLR